MRKKKLIKYIICGATVIAVGTVAILNREQLIDLTIDLIDKVLPDAVTNVFNSNPVDITDKLHLIGDPYKCFDIAFLKHIAEQEVICKLPKGELFGLIVNETSLNPINIMDSNGMVSYGATQIQFDRAKIAWEVLRKKGIHMAYPTIELLSKDKTYGIDLTSRYLQHLHSVCSNSNQVFHFWNCGNLTKYASNNHVYEYTINISKHIAKFAKILN